MLETSTQPEHEWLRQAQEGDFLAFERLHGALEPAIRRFVTRLIGAGQTVEDVLQDTFLALFTNLKRIDPVEKLRPYVFRIARNNCYDMLRRQGRYEQVSLDDDPVNVRVSFDTAMRGEQNTPEEAAHWLLLYIEVQEAMEGLPELQRQALILYSEEHMTYAEIAEVMDVTIGTIKSRIFHAKKNLRARVRPETLAALRSDTPARVDDDDEEMQSATSENTPHPEEKIVPELVTEP